MSEINIPTDALLCHWCNSPIADPNDEDDWVHKDSGKAQCDTGAWPAGRGKFPVHYPDTCRACQTMWAPVDLVADGDHVTASYVCNCGNRWICGYSLSSKRMPI